MMLNLSPQDVQLLRTHLARRVQHVEEELVHTDKFELQHELAAELARLRTLVEKIDAQSSSQPSAPAR